jgi:hypothetical protein
MGLTLTTEINTNLGSSNEAYLNIKKITFRKGDGFLTDLDSLDIDVNLYLSQADRENNPAVIASSYQIPRYFGVADIGSPGDLSDLKGASNLFEFAYSAIKANLEGRNISAIDS